MTNICQLLSPKAPVAADNSNQASPGAAGSEDANTFESLLPAAEKGQPAADGDVVATDLKSKANSESDDMEALAQAGLIPLVESPLSIQPDPIATIPADGISVAVDGLRHTNDGLPLSADCLSPNPDARSSESTAPGIATSLQTPRASVGKAAPPAPDAVPSPISVPISATTTNPPEAPAENTAAVPADPATRAVAKSAAIENSPVPAPPVPVAFRDPSILTAPLPTVENAPALPATAVSAGINTAILTPKEFAGMTAAKPGLAMPATTPQRSQRATTESQVRPPSNQAGPVSSLTVPPVVSGRAEVPPSHGKEDQSSNEQPTNPKQFTDTDSATLTSTPPAISFGETERPSSANAPSQVSQIASHTLQAVEKLRVSGQERVEVAVKLSNGHELTIQLRVANGQVTPTFRTDSEPLRTALEQNWSLFSQRTGDHELRITSPVFESPQTSSNMSDQNQQRDERPRTFRDPELSLPNPPSPRRPTSGTILSPAPIPAASTRVHLYA